MDETDFVNTSALEDNLSDLKKTYNQPEIDHDNCSKELENVSLVQMIYHAILISS